MDWKKKLKFILITSAFAVLILIVLTNVFNMTRVTEKDLKTYNQGLEYLNAGDYENAYFNFSNVSKNSAIYEIALLRQALCADELNDSSTASKKYRLFIEKYPDSVFIQKAYYALAQNYFKEKDFTRAEKAFNDIKKNFKDTEYTKAAGYYLGLIYKNRISEEKNEKEIETKTQKAKGFLLQYLEAAPDGRYSLECVKELIALNAPLSQKDNYLIGRAYFKNGFLQSARSYFDKSYMSLSWGYLSLIYKQQGDYKKSREIFETNYPKFSQNLEKETLYRVIENYASIYPAGAKAGWESALALAAQVTASSETNANETAPVKYAESSACGEDYILYRLTKYETPAAKNDLYRQIYTKHAQGDFASDAVANLFLNAYFKNDFQEAKMLGTIHVRDYQNTVSAPKVLFWMAKLSEKQGNRNEAKGFYKRVLEKYPDSYYAYRASKHLSYTNAADWKTKAAHRLSEKTTLVEFPFAQAQISDDNISIVNTILKLNDYKLLSEIDRENKAVSSWINYREQKYATAALLARDHIQALETKPDFSDSVYKLAYQLHYQDTINNYAKRYALDAYLISALIREESYFNPEARSSAGASGLMQLMPSTASYIAQRRGIPYNGVTSLRNPEVNIHLGCAYLSDAKQLLYNDDLLAVASYNGGPNAVKSWRDSLNYRNFDEFIENIPYPETRDYVKKVYRSYWVYLNVY